MLLFFKHRSFTALIIVFLFFCSCGSDLSDGGGTTVGNPPSVPASNLVPEFEQYLLETAVSDVASDAQSSLALVGESVFPSGSSFLTGPVSHWESFFLEGPPSVMRRLRTHFKLFGQAVSEELSLSGVTGFNADPVVLFVRDENFLDFDARWRVSIISPDGDSVRVVVRDADSGTVRLFYVYLPDDQGNPERGIITYIDPDRLTNSPSSGIRFIGMAFDFSDEAISRFSMTYEAHSDEEGFFITQHAVMQCDSNTQDCIAEFLRVDSTPPGRNFGTRLFRLGWNDSSREVCLANISYDESAEIGVTQKFIGPVTPGESEVSEAECVIDQPYWSERVYMPNDLPKRFEDDSSGGYANRLYGSGLSESSWEEFVKQSTIDDWLLGQF